jgi:hypothetical protein
LNEMLVADEGEHPAQCLFLVLAAVCIRTDIIPSGATSAGMIWVLIPSFSARPTDDSFPVVIGKRLQGLCDGPHGFQVVGLRAHFMSPKTA